MKTFILGFSFGLSLIAGIGPQNAYVIRQGFRKSHIMAITTLCILCDAILMSIGIFFAGSLIALSPVVQTVSIIAAILLMASYSFISFRSAFQSDISALHQELKQQPKFSAIITCLGFTVLNPHVYLDTIVLLGAMACRLPDDLRALFALGGITASAFWFYLIGFGTQSLACYLNSPKAWSIINFVIGLLMLGSAAALVRLI